MSSGPTWEIQLAGSLALYRINDGAIFTLCFDRTDAARLLGYLALYKDAKFSRFSLQSILADESNANPQERLKQALSSLRRTFDSITEETGDGKIAKPVLGNEHLSLSPVFSTDWARRERLSRNVANRASLVEAAQIGARQLLPQLQALWLDDERQLADVKQAELLQNLVRLCETEGDQHSAIQWKAVADALGKKRFGLPEKAINSRRTFAKARCHAVGIAPIAISPLFGRQKECAIITSFLQTAGSILVLEGPGGAGKTRLAQAAVDEGGLPAAFIPLISVPTPEAVPAAICVSLGIESDDQIAAVINTLKERRFLLVLDGAEHLLTPPEGGMFVKFLDFFAAIPDVKIIITSRRHIAMHRGKRLEVKPLATPPEEEIDTQKILRYDAIRFLEEQARQSDTRSGGKPFRVNSQNAAQTSALCRRLSGLPLYLRLVAPRLNTRSVKEVLNGLDESEAFLRQMRGTGAKERFPSREAAIWWSLTLLAPPERILFFTLSVFAASFSEENVHGVVGENSVHILRLHDDHLLATGETSADGMQRFFLLDALREFAERHLEKEQLVALRTRHSHYFALRADELAKQFGDIDTSFVTLSLYNAELPNILRAFVTLRKNEDWARLAFLAETIFRFVDARPLAQEAAQASLHKCLPLPDSVPSDAATTVLTFSHMLSVRRQDYQTALTTTAEMLRRTDAAPYPSARARALLCRAFDAHYNGSTWHDALKDAYAARGLAEETQDAYLLARAWHRIGAVQRHLVHLGEAEEAFLSATVFWRECGYPAGKSLTQINRAAILVDRAILTPEDASPLLEMAEKILKETRPVLEAMQHHTLLSSLAVQESRLALQRRDLVANTIATERVVSHAQELNQGDMVKHGALLMHCLDLYSRHGLISEVAETAQKMLQTLRRIRQPKVVLITLMQIGELAAHSAPAVAVMLWSAVKHLMEIHETASWAEWDARVAYRANIAGTLAPDERADAEKRGRALKLWSALRTSYAFLRPLLPVKQKS